MKKDNIILLILGSPFLLGIFYFVFGVGIISSVLLSLGLTSSGALLLEGLTMYELHRITTHGVGKIKTRIFRLKEELSINKSYLEEVERFFTIGKINRENSKKVTEILTFKSLFQNTDVEKKVYQIQKDIDDLFTLFNDKYINTSDIEHKKDIVQKVKQMNESKKELGDLLQTVKLEILGLMKENLQSLLDVREKLTQEVAKHSEKVPYYYKKNITDLSQSITNLQVKIKHFESSISKT